MMTLTKTATAGLAAITIMMGASAMSTSANAGTLNVAPAFAAADVTEGQVTKVHHRWRRRWRHRRHGYGAAAAIFGFAAGAALASQAYRGRDCGYVTVRKKRWNRRGHRVIVKRRVWVCD